MGTDVFVSESEPNTCTLPFGGVIIYSWAVGTPTFKPRISIFESLLLCLPCVDHSPRPASTFYLILTYPLSSRSILAGHPEPR
jgi:hypothetical protein